MEISSSTAFPEGVVINIDKPLGWTSTDVVRKIKPMLRQVGYPKIKIGHAGTLDPLASGVLLVCVGKATKMVDALQAQQKEYVAKVELGATTPSYDLEHQVDRRYQWQHITEEALREALKSMEGVDIEQVPPIYSAKRIDGKRAYDYARDGQEVEMRMARVSIYQAELVEYAPPVATIRVVCSKGTYIRSIARDLGVALDSGGHLVYLRRTRSGEYLASEGISMEELQEKLLSCETNI